MLIVYEHDAISGSNGLGTINPIESVETCTSGLENWSIEVTVPGDSNSLIEEGRVVRCRTLSAGYQLFVISDKIERKNGQTSFTAKHVLYDMENYVLVKPVSGSFTTAAAAMGGCTFDQKIPFTILTDETPGTSREVNLEVGTTALDALKQISAVFGVIPTVSDFDITFRTSKEAAGSGQVFHAVYGRNIASLEVGEDWSEVCTRVIATCSDGTLPGGAQIVDGPYAYKKPHTKAMAFDVPTKNENGTAYTDTERANLLKSAAIAYLNTPEAMNPKRGYSISIAPVSDGYRLSVYDSVCIEHPLAETTADCIGYTYDTESGTLKSVTVGDYDPRAIATVQTSQQKTKDDVNAAVSDVAALNARVSDLEKGGSSLPFTSGNGKFDAINSDGFGFSGTTNGVTYSVNIGSVGNAIRIQSVYHDGDATTTDVPNILTFNEDRFLVNKGPNSFSVDSFGTIIGSTSGSRLAIVNGKASLVSANRAYGIELGSGSIRIFGCGISSNNKPLTTPGKYAEILIKPAPTGVPEINITGTVKVNGKSL